MSRHMLVILLVLTISMMSESRPQLIVGNEDVEFIQPPKEKRPTELFFGPVGGFVGEVQVSTGSLTVNKKPRRKPSRKQENNGPRTSALISDNSFSNFRSFDSPSLTADVAVAAGPALSISSGGSVVAFNKPVEVVPVQR